MLIRGNSSLVEHPVQPEEGGSIPTLPLHKLLRVERCNLIQVQGLIKRLHYSHSCFGVTADYCYRVLHDERLVGGAIFGLPAAYNVARKYDGGESLLELRRFVLIDALPRNSESFCLGVMLRALRKEGVKRVLSYADPAHGHAGTIYAASGFTFMGETKPRKHVLWKGKKYPDRNIHQTNFPFHKELREALASGEAERVAVPGKRIWVKRL
jgi:hypothetical protein